jgi:hypothetical protein
MTNRFMLSVAAAALIAGAGFANAQGTGGHQGTSGSTAQQSAPSSGAGGSATQGREATESSSPKSDMKSSQSEQKSGMGKSEQKSGMGKNERAEEPRGQKSNSMSSENDRAKGGKDMKAEGRQDRNNMKAEGREDRDHNRNAQGREDRDRNKNAESREDRRGNMNAEGREGRSGSAESRSQSTTGQAGAGAKLSTEQRTKITSVIREQHVKPVENVNFSISVGTRVPRDVSFHQLPSQIVTIYPEWRGYEYFLVRSQIVVVDPRTLEIVAVLEA